MNEQRELAGISTLEESGGGRAGQLQRGCGLIAARKRRPGLRRLDLDDVIAHRHDQGDQLVVVRLGDVQFVERRVQVLHGDVELTGRDRHPVVCLPHGPAGVGARPPAASHSWSMISFLSRGISDRTNFPLARSSPPTRATHDSVSAVITSRPPSRSYSDAVCVVICSPLNRLVRPLLCFCRESRPGSQAKSFADATQSDGQRTACSSEGARRLARPNQITGSLVGIGPLSQQDNSRGCRSEAERVQMAWRPCSMRTTAWDTTVRQDAPAASQPATSVRPTLRTARGQGRRSADGEDRDRAAGEGVSAQPSVDRGCMEGLQSPSESFRSPSGSLVRPRYVSPGAVNMVR